MMRRQEREIEQRWEGRRQRGVCSLGLVDAVFGGNDPPSPPDYTPIANANAEAARYAKEAADNDLAFRKQQYEEAKPRLAQLADLAAQVGQSQLDISEDNKWRARQQQQIYEKVYMPNELGVALDAYGQQYLSDDDATLLSHILGGDGGYEGYTPQERERMAMGLSRKAEGRAGDMAATKAEAQSNSNMSQAMREVARMGGDPSRVAAAAADVASRGALTRTDASNRARESVRGQQVGLRTGLANFGRNMPNTAGQAFGLATQAGSAAVNSASQGANANLPYSQYVSGGYGGQYAAAGIQQQGALGLGNIQSGDYRAGLNYSASTAANQGDMLGTVLGAGLRYYLR